MGAANQKMDEWKIFKDMDKQDVKPLRDTVWQFWSASWFFTCH